METDHDKAPRQRAAVLGLGVTGVAAVKNLREAGFEVEGYDQNEYFGGLWQWSSNPHLTTALKNTRANIAKQRNCYQDFPFAKDVSNYPSGEELLKYIQDYARHFDLEKHFRLGLKAERVERSADDTKWTIRFMQTNSEPREESFDKVLVATGPYNKPLMPEIPGASEFKGRIMHAQAYKGPQDFVGKKVVVVGLSNTGGDVAVDLVGTASEVYMSHRSGARILHRAADDTVPMENRLTRRMVSLGLALNQYLPWLGGKLSTLAMEKTMKKANPNIEPSWNILPAPPITNSTPIVNDHILSDLAKGTILSKPGIKRCKAPSSIEFTDQTIVENVDAIIFGTGYQADYSIFAPEADPTAFPTPEWDRSPHTNGLKYPRLYQGLFSTVYPQSLAFIGPFRGHSFAVFNNADLSTTAVAQAFAGNHPLPSKAEREAWCDHNYALNCKSIQVWRMVKPACDPRSLEHWLNAASGNGVNENLGWGLQGWKFWWNEQRLYRKLVDGTDTPHIYRLFDSQHAINGREKWMGARAAIEEANKKQ